VTLKTGVENSALPSLELILFLHCEKAILYLKATAGAPCMSHMNYFYGVIGLFWP